MEPAGDGLQSSIAAQLRLNARTIPDRPAIEVIGGGHPTVHQGRPEAPLP